MSKIEKYMKRYCLKFAEFKKVDLRTLYCQYRPGIDPSDLKIINSSHFELADLYYKNGLSWLEKNFSNTKYFTFQKYILKINPHFPKKKIHLFDSLKKGYLRKGHEKDHVVILNIPFICSRYGLKNVFAYSPEIYIGHHRSAALIALGEYMSEVMVATDDQPMTHKCNSKLHKIYKEIK